MRFFFGDLVEYTCFSVLILVCVCGGVNLFRLAVEYRSSVLSVVVISESEIWIHVSVPVRSLFV